MEIASFLKCAITHFKEDGWSLDACFGRALSDKESTREQMVCTKTLYRYVEMGFLAIKNIDLPEKLRRGAKHHRIRESRKKLGTSIEERPENIENRLEFGHWEIDSVLGKKSEKEPAILVLTERKLRESIWLKVENHSADAVDNALSELFESYGEKWHEVFKSISDYSADDILIFADIINGLPRKVLGYRTPDELFEAELERIYTVP